MSLEIGANSDRDGYSKSKQHTADLAAVSEV
nr:MAG TPA: hypothetical protein [Caudoviricetes sp.]